MTNRGRVKSRGGKGEDAEERNFNSGKFLVWAQEKHFCDCPVIAAGNFRLSY